jgi:hypothetical protein
MRGSNPEPVFIGMPMPIDAPIIPGLPIIDMGFIIGMDIIESRGS